MKMKTHWHIHFAIITVPFSVPLVAGGYWLWLNQMLIIWLGVSAAAAVGWWTFNWCLKRKDPELELLDISKSIGTSKQSQLAYKRLEAISAMHRNTNPDLASSRFYIQTLIEVMQTVAEQYYPLSKDAILEIKLPYLLKVIEMLVQDLRHNLSENVPGSHVFSLNDLVRTRNFANRGLEIYRLIRIVSAGLDPVSSMIRELKMLATDNVMLQKTDDLKCWLIDAYIKKIGYYAIELYSGNLILDDNLLTHPTRSTQQELESIARREKALATEPFRILVMGQTNAGKSSLINALFGAKKAATGAIPATKGFTSFLLQRPGLETAVIMDCEGYGGVNSRLISPKIADEISRSDMIIMVVSATNAGRDVDKKMLQAIHTEFSKQGKSSLPPVIVALTHIDQLRPLREWSPPYDIFNPCSAKAQAIRLAIETVAIDLGLKLDQIAPVTLKPGFEYNIDEGLIPVIFQHLEQAQQTRYLRCLKEYRKEDHWRLVWKQSKKAGRFIANKGLGSFEYVPKLKSALPMG